jgi:rhomboid-related protein 1/2/3
MSNSFWFASDPDIKISLINDEWRNLFDKFDAEGFGEIPLEAFDQALASKDFRDNVAEGKIDILRDKVLQLQRGGRNSITFQEFVNVMTRKRTLSFKCAIHCRDKQVQSPDDFKLKSISEECEFLAGDLHVVIAEEVLPNAVDRRFYLSACRPKLPVFLLALCVAQIVVFFAERHTLLQVHDALLFHAHRLNGVWRFFTYALVHDDVLYLGFNLACQLAIGVPVEMVHGTGRTLLIFVSGVFAGSVLSTVFDSAVSLSGASAGVFSLVFAQLAVIVINIAQVDWRAWCRVTVLLLVASVEVGVAIFRRAHPNQKYMQTSYVGHVAGVLTGCTLGAAVFDNFEQSLRRQRIFWTIVTLYFGALLALLVYVAVEFDAA